MARDGSGTFTLPLPDVVAGTDIEASWANTTLTDVETELTDSLSRSGKGGMSAALKLASGTVSAPGLSFTSEANSGLYREAAGDMRVALAGAEFARITSAGLRLASTGLVLGTAGQGISFAANTGTAATGAATTNEVLTVYEEGTWTPNLWDATASSSESQTYGSQVGLFTRIGRIVFVEGYMNVTSLGTLTTTDQVWIGPLPYTSKTSFALGGINVSAAGNITFSPAGSVISGDVQLNANYIRLWYVRTSTAQSVLLPVGAFTTSSSDIAFNGFYFV